MGIIKESLEIDFEVINRPLTQEEEMKISDFIKSKKEEINTIEKNKGKRTKLKQKI